MFHLPPLCPVPSPQCPSRPTSSRASLGAGSTAPRSAATTPSSSPRGAAGAAYRLGRGWGLGAGGWGGETPCTAQQKREVRCPRCCRSHSCRWLGGWTGAFALNAIVVSSMAVGGLGFGGYRCAALTTAVPLYAAALPDPLTGQAPPHPPYHAHADGLPHVPHPPAPSWRWWTPSPALASSPSATSVGLELAQRCAPQPGPIWQRSPTRRSRCSAAERCQCLRTHGCQMTRHLRR